METNVKTDIERGAMEERAEARASVFDGRRVDGLPEGASVEELREWVEGSDAFFGDVPERTREPDDGSGHDWPHYDGGDPTPEELDPLAADRAKSFTLEPLRYDDYPSFEDLEAGAKPDNRDWRKAERQRYSEILAQVDGRDLGSEEAEQFVAVELCAALDRFRFPQDPEWDEANPGRTRGYKELKPGEIPHIKPVEEQVQFLVTAFQERIAEALRNAEWVEGSFQDEQFLADREFIAALLFRAGAESQAYHHWDKYDNAVKPGDPKWKYVAGYYVKYISRQRTGNQARLERERIKRRHRERSSKINEGQQALIDISPTAKRKIAKKKSVRRVAFDTRYNRKVGLALMRICNPDTVEFLVRAFRLNESGNVPERVPRDRIAEVYAGTPMHVLVEGEETEVGKEAPVFA